MWQPQSNSNSMYYDTSLQMWSKKCSESRSNHVHNLQDRTVFRVVPKVVRVSDMVNDLPSVD